MADIIKVTDRVSYIKATEKPLSADVGIVEGDESVWIFDVGADESVPISLNKIPKAKNAVISHFHPDHMSNLEYVDLNEVYLGANTFKYAKRGTVVDKDVFIDDGITIHIFPLPSSHAKGSLAMCVDGICFLGDAAYPGYKLGKKYHNANFLRSLVDFLKMIDSEEVFYSHEKNPVKTKEVILGVLESIQANWREEKGLLFKK